VFDQLRLTAYDLSVDMLDVHAVSIVMLNSISSFYVLLFPWRCFVYGIDCWCSSHVPQTWKSM